MDHREQGVCDLCENAHELIQTVSPEGKFLYVNRSWLRTLGYDRNDLVSLSFFDILHEDSRARCQEALQRLTSGQSAVDIEAEFLSRDGRRIAVEGSATARFQEGRLTEIRGIFRDVTQRRRAEEDLERLFNLSLDLLCIAGTDGYFKRVNPAFEKVLGYSREELLSRSFLDFVHPDDRPGTLNEVSNLAQGLPVVDFNNRYRSREGAYRWLAWRSMPMPGRGLIYAVARDITEQKRSQELLARQAEELARSNADLEQFAYVASHDLRAPLRGITNLAEWIEEDLRDGQSDRTRHHLAQLRARARRMEALIDDLLKYARAGRESSAIATVDTAALIGELASLLGPPEGFRVIVAPDMPVFRTNQAPLEQVFRNLIGNAIKHHDRPNGRVTVSVCERGPFYEFCVADDGPGIPERFRDRLFQMFQRLGSRDQVEGTGIGLALVKRIVEGHGGTVGLDPAHGRGATFRFTWPKRLEGGTTTPDSLQGAAEERHHADDPDRR